jgi:hypothetical protein
VEDPAEHARLRAAALGEAARFAAEAIVPRYEALYARTLAAAGARA